MVPFCKVLYPEGNVEDWLLEVEKVMRLSLKEIIRDSLQDYQKVRKEVLPFFGRYMYLIGQQFETEYTCCM